MFERVYSSSRWSGPVANGGLLASLGIHAVACALLVAGGADPAALTSQVTEGIIFLAPRPSPAAGPSAPAERLRYADLSSSVGAMSPESDLHAGSPTPARAIDDGSIGTPLETPVSI